LSSVVVVSRRRQSSSESEWSESSSFSENRPHREFVKEMQRQPTARSFVASKTQLEVHKLAVLEAEFNGCLDDLLRFCSRRSQLVCRYLPAYAADFRKNEFEDE